MLKLIPPSVWCFDAEWVPDPDTGRRVYGLPAQMPDDDVIARMWQEGGASDDEPRPYLKTVLCRVVSIAAVIRSRDRKGKVNLRIHSLPPRDNLSMSEPDIISRFLGGVGKNHPGLVGFNSQNADLPILIQRSLVHALSHPDFGRRPSTPWKGVDYFARSNDYHVDLKEAVGGWGKGTPSLHELATACRIPGKLGTSGGDVFDLWRSGKIEEIVRYNECDAVTTYLLWLRVALMAGLLKRDEYKKEWKDLHLRLQREYPHLGAYLKAWDELTSTA